MDCHLLINNLCEPFIQNRARIPTNGVAQGTGGLQNGATTKKLETTYGQSVNICAAFVVSIRPTSEIRPV